MYTSLSLDAWFCREARSKCSPSRPGDVSSPCAPTGTSWSSPPGDRIRPHTGEDGTTEGIDREAEHGAYCTSSLTREACPDSDLNGVDGNGVELTEVTAAVGSLVDA